MSVKVGVVVGVRLGYRIGWDGVSYAMLSDSAVGRAERLDLTEEVKAGCDGWILMRARVEDLVHCLPFEDLDDWKQEPETRIGE